MLYINNDQNGNSVINLTVGDDATITVQLNLDDETEYEMGPNDYLIFSVRERPSEDSPLLLEIESELGSADIVFKHDDTSELAPGYYSAEVQLMPEGGKRFTVWPKLTGNSKVSQSNRKNFCLMTEVVYR